MDDCVAAVMSKGASVLLISGSRGLYRRMGCIDAGRYRTARAPRGAMRPEAGREVREWRLADVPRMAELHRAEPVRFERTQAEWYAFLRTGRVATHPCRTWTVSARGRPDVIEAFLCAQEAEVKPQGRMAAVHEMAGSREAVLEALPTVIEAMRADGVDVSFLGSACAMAALAARHGFEVAPRGFDGTVKVIDPPGAVAALRHLVGAGVSIEAGEDGFVFRLGGESFAVRGLEEVTAFLFGSMERQAAFPGPGHLRSRLEAVFPIPLPDYGFNYI